MDTDENHKIFTVPQKKGKKIIHSKRHNTNVGTFFQSVWFRCCSIFTDIMDREFMVCKFYFVLYCGSVFWILHLFHQIIK
jgi:hypothetical protein